MKYINRMYLINVILLLLGALCLYKGLGMFESYFWWALIVTIVGCVLAIIGVMTLLATFAADETYKERKYNPHFAGRERRKI